MEEEDEQNVEKDVENIRPNISVKRSEQRVKEKNAQDVEDDKYIFFH